jgi:hypothetical protein
MLPSAKSRSSRAARSSAIGGMFASTCRSNRFEASDGSLCLRTVRAIDAGSQTAASRRMSVLSSRTSVLAPPITPASDTGPVSSAMTMSSGSSSRTVSSSVVSFSPGFACRTTSPPLIDGVSKACMGWPISSIT